MKIKANAKINLFLDIESKRPDGYHNIRSVMQEILLHDDVSIRKTAPGTGITLHCHGRFVPNDITGNEKNTAMRAARLFSRETGINPDVCIKIKKNIPMKAGLGGGSADAAAVLILLDRIHKTSLGTARLCEIGAKIGADVPFCILGGTAVARGIGDILEPLPSLKKMWLVLIKEGDGVATPAAYSELDSLYGDFSDGYQPKDNGYKDITAVISKNDCNKNMQLYNIFENCKSSVPCVDIKKHLLSLGARSALMSGSGSAVFGIFDTRESAVRCAGKLRREYGSVRICKTKFSDKDTSKNSQPIAIKDKI